jgi:hypothetical protein
VPCADRSWPGECEADVSAERDHVLIAGDAGTLAEGIPIGGVTLDYRRIWPGPCEAIDERIATASSPMHEYKLRREGLKTKMR